VLPVTVPSHTPLMAEASRSFRQALGKAHLPAEAPSGVRLLSGIDGDTVFDVLAGADKLARQIQQTVDCGLPACSLAARPTLPRLLNSDRATRSLT
jgi:[acyl-carrier-protein] S-malonyltransferase